MIKLWDRLKSAKGIIMNAILRTQRDDNPGGRGTVTETTEIPIDYPEPMRLHRLHVVIPKEYINTMPIWWQRDFARFLHDLHIRHGYDATNHDFQILKRDSRGRFEEFPVLKDRQEAAQQADELF